ncbi:hypothetical protein ScPMuIL_011645 [Solemya velum]
MAAATKLRFRFLTYSKFSQFRKLTKKECNRNEIGKRFQHTVAGDRDVDSTEENRFGYDHLYPGHIPTSTLQKWLLSVGSAGMAIVDPYRDDMIATFGETAGSTSLKWMHKKMMADPEGQEVLRDRPVINTKTITIPYLGSLPEGTFGRAYWQFLKDNKFSPDARLPVHFVDDPELMYVMLRYRQLHDLFHTLLGMPPNMLGEVLVKWVEAFQTRLPMCITGAMFGAVRLGPKDTSKYLRTYLPWAIRNGRQAKFLMGVYYEKHWEQDLDELRRDLNIEPPPIPLVRKKN